MNAKLRTIKRLIEKETGVAIDSESRHRSITYPRAVFCKVARHIKKVDGKPLTLAEIGEPINRDHCTVLYNCSNVFRQAYSEDKYRSLYHNLVSALKSSETEEEMYSYIESMDDLYDKLSKANQKIAELSYSLELHKSSASRVSELLVGLTDEEKDEVSERLELIVKSIKSRVYL